MAAMCMECQARWVKDGDGFLCDKCKWENREGDYTVVVRVFIDGFGRKRDVEQTVATLRRELGLKFDGRVRADVEVVLREGEQG